MVIAQVFFFLLTIYYAYSEKCYAMTMEGGGMCGAYEAGVLMALTELLPASILTYKVIGGISIGSYNTCWSSGFAIGEERNMAIHLQNIWLSVNQTNQVFRYRRPLIWALFWAPSLTDNAAALKLITKNSGNSIRRNVTVGTTNINTGELINFNETLGIESLPTACWASGAYPLAFPPVSFMGEYFIDGCATANLNGFIVIDRCRELGFDYKDIVVDLLFDVHPQQFSHNKVNKTKEAISKINALRKYYHKQWFISQLQDDFPDVEFRYVISPSQELSNHPTIEPGDFKFKIDLGYNDTVALLNKSQAERSEDFKKKFTINPHFS